jgi:hypothetical protein
MSRGTSAAFVEEEIKLLVDHFGLETVQSALATVSSADPAPHRPTNRKSASAIRTGVVAGVEEAVAQLRDCDPERHSSLSLFLVNLRGRQILPEFQDIKQFAQLAGIKDLQSRSRGAAVGEVVQVMLKFPIETLRSLISAAETISAKHRQRGFSVLTEKLLGKAPTGEKPSGKNS